MPADKLVHVIDDDDALRESLAFLLGFSISKVVLMAFQVRPHVLGR